MDDNARFVMLLAQAQRLGLLDEVLQKEPDLARIVATDWNLLRRPDQTTPDGDWITWLQLAGRGAGKTRTGAEWIHSLVDTNQYGSIAFVGETVADVRDVMIEGPSGIMHTGHPDKRPSYRSSRRKLEWPNGAIGMTYSAEDPGQLRGPQFSAAWSDELAKWQYAEEAWDNLQFGLRLGANPRQTVTTTPRPMKLLREMIKEFTTKGDKSTVVVTRASTRANAHNLAPAFLKKIIGKYEGTRLGRQEIDAELLNDNPYALWSRTGLDQHRVKSMEVPELGTIVVAIDPAVTSGEDADETGIVVAGCTRGSEDTKHFFVLEDATTQGMRPVRDTPSDDPGWADVALIRYKTHRANSIIGEVNNGGEMVEQTIRRAAQDAEAGPVMIRQVRASKGKVVRAEPISALYAQGRVHHVGTLARLEDQMCEFTSDFDKKTAGYSPDRVDALVWALTDLSMGRSQMEDIGPSGPEQFTA